MNISDPPQPPFFLKILFDCKNVSCWQGGKPHDAQRKPTCKKLFLGRSGQIRCEFIFPN